MYFPVLCCALSSAVFAVSRTDGSVTYAVNPRAMEGRYIVGVADSGWYSNLKESFPEKLQACFNSRRPVGAPEPTSLFGDLTSWFHLALPHDLLMNCPYIESTSIPSIGPTGEPITCCNYSLADLFNRWWASGPLPESGMLITAPYYEVILLGNLMLPEDVLYIVAKVADVDSIYPCAHPRDRTACLVSEFFPSLPSLTYNLVSSHDSVSIRNRP